MTVPSTGAVAYTVRQSDGPKLLIRNAETGDAAPLIVNNGTVRLYVAGDAMLAPSTAIPVEAGTCLPWSAGGEVYGLADPADTKPATCFVTAAIDDWSPSPAVLAGQVAAQLVASQLAQNTAAAIAAAGVPITNPAAIGAAVPAAAAIGTATAQSVAQTGVPILQSSSPVLAGVLTQPPPGNISASLDCSQYDALNIGFQDQASTGNAGDVISANILWYSSTGSLLSTQTVGLVRIANGIQDQIEVQMPVLGPQCRIQNGSVLNTGTLGYVAVFQTCAGVPSPRIAGQAVGLDDRVIIQCPANVPASGTVSIYGRPLSGRARMVFLGTGAASNTVFASLFGYFGGKGWQQVFPRQQNLITGSANNGQQSWDFPVPFGVPLRLDVQNNGTGVVSPNIQIFDISDV